MPSFDIVSKVNIQEVRNAVDQANREILNRFDFKDVDAHFELSEQKVILTAPTAFQIQQMRDILQNKLTKRQVEVTSLDYKPVTSNLHQSKQEVEIRQGIDAAIAKNITKFIKDSKIKVQASIQGDQVRVTGKDRDDLQTIIAMVRGKSFDLPLQFENFRD